MPHSEKKPVKRTRALERELNTPIANRRKPRVANQFPSLSSYSALAGHPGVSGARKGGHLFIRFDNPRVQVRIPVSGHYNTDATLAQNLTGAVAGPGEVWHHVADIDERRRGTVQLVPTATHAAIGHWGGSAISKRYRLAHTGLELNSRGIAVSVGKPKPGR